MELALVIAVGIKEVRLRVRLEVAVRAQLFCWACEEAGKSRVFDKSTCERDGIMGSGATSPASTIY